MATEGFPTAPPQAGLHRSNSISQQSENSQTAAEFITNQLQLEADAREALPYQFDTCTRPLGALKQSLFSCLTCNPPPASPDNFYTPAGVCYSCSISCHGEHILVELFAKRNFVCDCGTTRLPTTAPCTLRRDESTGLQGNVTGEEPAKSNRYNQNFQNRFCGCEEEYNPHEEKGTMFQCIGLGTAEDGGCGEDWWHSECLVGISRSDWKKHVEELDQAKRTLLKPKSEVDQSTNGMNTIPEYGTEDSSNGTNGPSQANGIASGVEDPPEEEEEEEEEEETEEIVPEGFPKEDDFEYLICYKCADAFPWIKQYSGASGFLHGVVHTKNAPIMRPKPIEIRSKDTKSHPENGTAADITSRKRKSSEDGEEKVAANDAKRHKSDLPIPEIPTEAANGGDSEVPPWCKRTSLPSPTGQLSLFLEEDFRDHICKCTDCFTLLKQNPQLIEEEETYEPPVSEDGDGARGGSVGTGSLLDRGEAVLSNMDRVRAIEGAMVYNQLKDKVKTFLKPFAESGEAVGAEDIKAYFEKLRGDVEAMKAAKGSASEWRNGEDRDGDEPDSRKEQSGF